MPITLDNTGVTFDDSTSQTTAATNTAANVTSVNGDTGAVTVNVIGNGQTWQNVTASRTKGTVYTNTTGRPILVNVSWLQSTSVSNYLNGVLFSQTGGSYAVRDQLFYFVPSGHTYQINPGIVYWWELR